MLLAAHMPNGASACSSLTDADRRREEVEDTTEEIVSTVAVRPLGEMWRSIGSKASPASFCVLAMPSGEYGDCVAPWGSRGVEGVAAFSGGLEGFPSAIVAALNAC